MLVAGIATASVNAQTFKPSGNSPAELCTAKEYTTAEGDLNKDGIKDLFINAKTDYSFNESAFYFGIAGGGYTLFRKYDMGTHSDNSKITVNANGVLRIQTDRDEGSDIFLFRYQNGGMFLIGGKMDRHKNQHFDYSFNFSTGKMIRTDGEGTDAKTTTIQMSKMPQLKYGWFPLNWNMIEYLVDEHLSDTDFKTVMGIFRRMQDDEMMHWAFCEYDNPYKNPDGGNGHYECENDFTGGSYWIYEHLKFDRQTNGTWRVELSGQHGERTYEEYTDEDGETYSGGTNQDAEESEPPSIWIFTDGNFVKQ